MANKDPHVVLGVAPDASAATIKAAWRRLAREHHPDLTGDAASARAATRRMAEINAAYEQLRDGGTGPTGANAGRSSAGPGPASGSGTAAGTGTAGRAAGGPPRPRPGRPVTGRVDTSDTVRPRNATTSRRGTGLAGQPPLRGTTIEREPRRASDPNGPLERGRIRNFRRPPDPSLADALAIEAEFGKFRGHTLGQIAAFEPSYIDWLARTITRDPDLVAGARVVKADLDRRGVRRPNRPAPQFGRRAV